MPRRFLVAGNHKMNGSVDSVQEIVMNITSANLDPNTEVVIAPPSIFLYTAQTTLASTTSSSFSIEIGAQNVSCDIKEGAQTGEISVSQLKALGINWVILGHSERRKRPNSETDLRCGESDDLIASKLEAALTGNLKVILCCGESDTSRTEGATMEVVERQLKSAAAKVPKSVDWEHIVIAYEPIWAIGTGKTASPAQAQEVHAGIRNFLETVVSKNVADNTRILYGGSVNEKNCKELAKQPDIDGFLVGGASLKLAFVDIINAKLP